MDDDVMAAVRREHLNAYCVKRGWVSQKDNTKGSPSELSRRLGRGVAFWSNVLRDPKKSFGPVLAREIEQKLSLPKYFLEGESPQYDVSNIVLPVERYDIELSAGGGALAGVVEKKSPLFFRKDFFNCLGIQAKNAFVVKVRGDSMASTFYSGSTIMIDTAATAPRNGEVYAFVYNHELLVKRFFIEQKFWIARSDNPNFGDIVLDGSVPFRILGKAVWVAQRM